MSKLTGSFSLKPERALAFFRGKGLKVTFSWQDMLHEEHDHAFTVAKMADLDLLAEVQRHFDRALAEGLGFKRFAAELRPKLEAAGWWGKQMMTDPETGEERLRQLGSPRRLRTIYDANMRTSYAAGRWAGIAAGAKRRPYVMYSAIMDTRVRPQHAAWNGTILRWDDPWWQTHTPPNGWNCRCTVISLSQRDLDRMGRTVSEPPPSSDREWTNPRTGEVIMVPAGIDPGWGYAPGASRREAMAQLALERAAAAPAPLGEAALPQLAKGLRREGLLQLKKDFDALVARRRQLYGVRRPKPAAKPPEGDGKP